MSSISRLPKELIINGVFAYLTPIKNALRLDAILKTEGQELASLAATCQQFQQFVKKRLDELKQTKELNRIEFKQFKSKTELFPPMIHMSMVCENKNQFLAYLRNGADINERNKGIGKQQGLTVFELAKKMKRDEFLKIIQAHPQFKP